MTARRRNHVALVAQFVGSGLIATGFGLEAAWLGVVAGGAGLLLMGLAGELGAEGGRGGPSQTT